MEKNMFFKVILICKVILMLLWGCPGALGPPGPGPL